MKKLSNKSTVCTKFTFHHANADYVSHIIGYNNRYLHVNDEWPINRCIKELANNSAGWPYDKEVGTIITTFTTAEELQNKYPEYFI